MAQKILNKIKDFLSIFKNTNANKKTIQKLRKAEMLFEKALKSVGKENLDNSDEISYSKKDYKAEDFADDGNELSNSDRLRYSFKGKTFPYYGRGDIRSEANEMATRWAKQEHIKVGWQKLFSYNYK